MNVKSSASALPLNTDERNFYIVMHHMATVLWMKGLTAEGLAALSAVLEWANSLKPCVEGQGLCQQRRSKDG